ncbi:MAG: DGQHR domain-containing protein [Solirubrobacteraceae bacterium]
MASLSATRVSYNGYTYYVGVVSGKLLLANSRVSRRAEDPEQGFNRNLQVSRAREIARYLETEHSSIPTNIVLSAQSSANLSFHRGRLTWDEAPSDSFLVLDGQHRLFSMQHTDLDYDFAVAIYADLTPQQEVQLFVDINTKQKGVPPALLLDIKQLAGSESTTEEKLRQLFDAVAQDPASPLRGQMSPAATKAGMVSRVTFNTALKKPIETGTLSQTGNDEDRSRLVINYLTAVRRIMRQSGAQRNDLTKATILQAFFEIFDEVVDQTLTREGALRPDNFTVTLEPLVALDFDEYVGSNRPSKAKLVADMRAQLTSAPAVTADML